jgi:Concanavalin A-like lectin/glucanases superfamily
MNRNHTSRSIATALGIASMLAWSHSVSAQPAAPYTPDAYTIVLDHFDGSTVGSVGAYRNVSGCGTPLPSVTPSFAYGPGQTGFGQALTLSPPSGEPAGSASYVRYPGGQLLQQAAGTLEFFAYLSSYEGGAGLVMQAPYFGACAGYTFHMVVDANGQLQANAHDFGFNVNSDTDRVPLNSWTHLAVTWDGTNGARLYINGRVVGFDANGRGPAPGYGGSVLVRAGSHIAGSNNRIDELRISNVHRAIVLGEPARLTLQHYAGIIVEGTVGATYRIEYTPALGSTDAWQTLTNLVLPASPHVFIDYDSPQSPRRFYRAVTP